MASNPLSVLVSIKTLCPEVDDYWLPIPSDLKTIDGLKRQILTDNFIVKAMDDIQLYLHNGLLRGNASIGDVLQNRDCIEVRVKSATKKRISSSVDNVSDRLKRIKISTNECTTPVDSNDETVVETESISGNQLKAFTEEIVNVVKNLIFDTIGGQSQDNSDGKTSIDSSTSVATISDTKTSSAAKVVTKSGDSCQPKSVAMKPNTPEVGPLWPSGSGQTADQWCGECAQVVTQLACREPHCDYKSDNRQHFLLHMSAIHRRFMCQFCDLVAFNRESKLATHYRRTHPSRSIPWVSSTVILTCGSPGCDFKTDNRHHFVLHRHIIHNQFMCQFCERQTFKSEHKLAKHHRRAHPNEFPDIPWIACTHEGCVYQTKDNKKLCEHIDKMHGLKVGVA